MTRDTPGVDSPAGDPAHGSDPDPDPDSDPATDDGATAAVVGDRLRARGETVAVAESMTGGLVAARLTAAPGASDYFDRATVTYAYDAKRAELGVDRELLDAHGAVSGPVAAAMARAIRDRADVDWGLSTTGIAGPGGGSDAKPVGLAYVGVAHAADWGSRASFSDHERLLLDGDRAAVRRSTADRAVVALAAALDRSGAD